MGSLTETLTYGNTFLGLTNEQGPNGDNTGVAYLNAAQPSQTTSPFGAVTSYAYTVATNASTVKATTLTHWTKSTMDGLGRTTKAEAGTIVGGTSTTLTQTDTVYDSCGCSPLGKLKQTSLPHAPGAGAVWTTYSYDGIGRTLSVLLPDSASTTTYSYQGNTVTVTDPAGAGKTYTSDAFGRLTNVQEPNPASGSFYTTYTYDMLDHLIGVSMPRPSGTQHAPSTTSIQPPANMLDAIEWAERSITIELHLLTGISEQVRNDVPGLAALQERPLDRPSRWVQCDLRRPFFLDAGPPFCWAESIRRGLRDLTQLMPVGRMQGCVI